MENPAEKPKLEVMDGGSVGVQSLTGNCEREQKSEEMGEVGDKADEAEETLESAVGDQSTTGNGKLNPLDALKQRAMNNEAIVEVLFEQCPKELQKKFRFVSKTWYNASLRPWRNTAPITVVHRSARRKSSEIRLGHFFKLMEDPNDLLKLSVSKNYSHKKYRLKDWDMSGGLINLQFLKFFNLLGANITQLELWSVTLDQWRTLPKIFCKRTPNLRVLILNNVRMLHLDGAMNVNDDYGVTNVKILKIRHVFDMYSEVLPWNVWNGILQYLTKIETFEHVNGIQDGTLNKVLQAMVNIRNTEHGAFRVKTLSVIRADGNGRCASQRTLKNGIIPLLSELNFPVEDLTVKFGCKVSVSSVNGFLELYNSTLKKLKFHLDYKPTSLEMFPHRKIVFPELEQMELAYWCYRGNLTSVNKILGAMPKLKTLKIHGIRHLSFPSVENSKNPSEEMQPSSTEKQMLSSSCVTEFSDTIRNLNVPQFTNLVSLIPSITKLELRVNNEIFRLICHNFPNLLELCVCGGVSLSDAGIIGGVNFPFRDLQTLELNHDVPKLSDLKRLRVFKVRNRNHKLTSASVLHGILQLPQIYEVEMSLPDGQISAKAREALEEKVACLTLLKVM